MGPRATLARQLAVLGVYSLATFLLWIPVAVWLGSPDRRLLDNRAELLIIGTAALQLLAAVLAPVLAWMARAWDDVASRRAAIAFGWIGCAAAPYWAFWAIVTAVPYELRSLWMWAAVCILLLVPALLPGSLPRARILAGIAATTVVLMLSAAVTVSAVTPILIAPAVWYGTATLLGCLCARNAAQLAERPSTFVA
ncbi:hypothetical protein ACFVU2_13565 [Leifsonia sp. NPDC058194]|uniref:hypothetical protein n=1 Tax=Leifsonia sp. NPDC058194 TaxID=3346374 RepID=UPI0036DE6759